MSYPTHHTTHRPLNPLSHGNAAARTQTWTPTASNGMLSITSQPRAPRPIESGLACSVARGSLPLFSVCGTGHAARAGVIRRTRPAPAEPPNTTHCTRRPLTPPRVGLLLNVHGPKGPCMRLDLLQTQPNPHMTNRRGSRATESVRGRPLFRMGVALLLFAVVYAVGCEYADWMRTRPVAGVSDAQGADPATQPAILPSPLERALKVFEDATRAAASAPTPASPWLDLTSLVAGALPVLLGTFGIIKIQKSKLKTATTAVEEIVQSIDKAQEPDGVINLSSPAVKALLRRLQSLQTQEMVDRAQGKLKRAAA